MGGGASWSRSSDEREDREPADQSQGAAEAEQNNILAGQQRRGGPRGGHSLGVGGQSGRGDNDGRRWQTFAVQALDVLADPLLLGSASRLGKVETILDLAKLLGEPVPLLAVGIAGLRASASHRASEFWRTARSFVSIVSRSCASSFRAASRSAVSWSTPVRERDSFSPSSPSLTSNSWRFSSAVASSDPWH